MEMNEQGLKYAGFWRRLLAHLIDTAIWMFPVFLIEHYLSGGNLKSALLIWGGLSWLLSIWYHLALQVKFGGTPGLRLMKVKIRKLDGSPVAYREVFLRFSPTLVFMALATVANFYTFSHMNDADFSLPMIERGKVILAATPSWTYAVVIATNIWAWSEFVVMMLNKQRRAIHDFIAGTVMLQDPK